MKYLLIVISCIFVMGCESSKAQNFSLAQDNTNGDSLRPSSQSRSINDQSVLKEQKFDLLHSSSKDIYNDYNVDVMKSLAFLIIAIGWFVTSNKSREFFRKSKTARLSALITAVVIGFVHIWSSISSYLLSQEKMSLLSTLNYLDPKYYRNYEITAMGLALNSLMIIALFGVLIVILCSLKETASESQRNSN